MANLSEEMVLWYGGNTYACVRPGLQTEAPSFCGQIVPPNEMVQHIMGSALGSVEACIRTENLEIRCGGVNKLYTPNFFVDNWGWFAFAIVAAYILYKDYRKRR
jgi:hypothetical protein